VYIHIHIYINICTCVYIWLYIYIYTYIHVYVNIYVSIYTYIYVRVQIYISINTCIFIHIFMCIFIYIYIPVYAFVYMTRTCHTKEVKHTKKSFHTYERHSRCIRLSRSGPWRPPYSSAVPVTQSYVWHDSFIGATRLDYWCDRAVETPIQQRYAWDTAPWLIHICDKTHSSCDMTRVHAWQGRADPHIAL